MKHISEVISYLSYLSMCPECEGRDATCGPVPDAEDRKRWISDNGDEVECPCCEGGVGEYLDERYLDGAHTEMRDCHVCDGRGEIEVERCSVCYRLEAQRDKGPKKIRERVRLDDLKY